MDGLAGGGDGGHGGRTGLGLQGFGAGVGGGGPRPRRVGGRSSEVIAPGGLAKASVSARAARPRYQPFLPDFAACAAASSTLARNLAGLALKSSPQPSQQKKTTRSGWPLAR